MASNYCAGMEKVFNRVRYINTDCWSDIWSSPDTDEPLHFAQNKISPDLTLLRVTQEVDMSFEDVLQAWNPELVFHHSNCGPSDDFFTSCHVESVLSPGDVLASFICKQSSLEQRTMSMLEMVFARPKPAGDGPNHGTTRVRMTVRENFPRVGCWTVAIVPLHPGTDELMEECGHFKAFALQISKHVVAPNKTVISFCKKLRAPWAFTPIAPVFGQFCRDFFTRAHLRMRNFQASTALQSWSAESQYVVIALRKCPHGNPLLPLHHGNPTIVQNCFDWEQFSGIAGTALDLFGYLRAFLRCIGIFDIEVYDRLNGRRLVNYQVALRRSDWARASVSMLEPFKSQRRAYRRIFGCVAAPELVLRPEARFREDESVGETLEIPIPVLGTFVHFGTNNCRFDDKLSAPSPRNTVVDDFNALKHSVPVC